MTDRASLTAGTTTDHAYCHCILITQIQHTEWRSNSSHMRLTLPEIALSFSAIDGDATISIGKDAHTRYRCLAASHTVVVLTLDGISQCTLLSSLLSVGLLFHQRHRLRPNYVLLSVTR